MNGPPPRFTLFPYPTLFRSRALLRGRLLGGALLRGPLGGLLRRSLGPPFREELRRALERDRGFVLGLGDRGVVLAVGDVDRKSTRLNSSHANISYAVFCLKK